MERFQSVFEDLRCREIPKYVRKVMVDKRFTKMLKNKHFKEGGRIDERGRVLDFTTSENLKKLYNFQNSSDEDSSENEQEAEKGSFILKSRDEADDFQEKKSEQLKEKNKKQDCKTNLSLFENFKSIDNDTYLIKDTKESSSNNEGNKSKISPNTSHNKVDLISNVECKEKHIKQQSPQVQDEMLSSECSEDDDAEEESGKKNVLESEESDDSESDDSSIEEGFDHQWDEWQEEAPNTDQIYKRLAVCSMDWDRIRASDLFTVFNSFKPADSIIHSVKIYPSEFGLKRMENENLNGPPELTEETLDPDKEEELDKKKAEYHREKLREYQLKRLKYYYAVVDCDTPETADHLYNELNFKEYESSSVRFDLRFIPDDVTFDHEPVSEVYEATDPSEYQPRVFNTTALGQVKVDLTWDETDPQRIETFEKAFTEPESIEKDLKNYLASSEESEDEQEIGEEEKQMKLSERIAKYKELLQSLEEKEGKGDKEFEKEITWESGLKEKTEKIVKQKLEGTSNPFDEMLKKRKLGRLLKKKEKKTEIDKDEDEVSSDFEESNSDVPSGKKPAEKESNQKLNELYLLSNSMKSVGESNGKTKKKRYKKKKQQQKDTAEQSQDLKFVQDERFSAIFTSPEFNIDPSDPHFKKTEGTLALIQEKQKRMKNKEVPSDESAKNKKFKYG